jgi:hypothetical protein
MNIHIAAGTTPKGTRRGDAVIFINALTVDNTHLNGVKIINLVSDSRYFSKINNKKYCSSVFRSPLFITNEVRNHIIDLDRFSSVYMLKNLGRSGFSCNIKNGVYHGCSSAYIALQIGVFLKAKRITVWGMDYSYGAQVRRLESGAFQLPDPLISETYRAIVEYAAPVIRNLQIEVKFEGSVF